MTGGALRQFHLHREEQYVVSLFVRTTPGRAERQRLHRTAALRLGLAAAALLLSFSHLVFFSSARLPP